MYLKKTPNVSQFSNSNPQNIFYLKNSNNTRLSRPELMMYEIAISIQNDGDDHNKESFLIQYWIEAKNEIQLRASQ